MDNNKKLLSFVIPCYNSINTLSGVLDEVGELLDGHSDYDYEVILVNDASSDNTYDLIREKSRNDSRIIRIDLATNRGQHAAIMAGLARTKGDIVICVDDDGQTPIFNALELVKKLDDGYDVVCGHFVERKGRSLFRRIGSRLDGFITNFLLDRPKGIQVTVFFAAKRFVIDEIIKYKNPYPYLIGLIIRTTKYIGNVDVVQRERFAGRSGYNLKKLISLWLNGFTAFSIKPLRIATVIGILVAIFGFIIGIVLIINKLIDPQYVLGWISTIATILFTTGIIMLMLGLIGEYLGRIYISINNSPQYVVRTDATKQTDKADNG